MLAATWTRWPRTHNLYNTHRFAVYYTYATSGIFLPRLLSSPPVPELQATGYSLLSIATPLVGPP